MKYQIKHFWLKVVIAGLVIGAVGVFQYMNLSLFTEYQWFGLVQMVVYAIVYALLFGRATFIGTVYSSIVSTGISLTYLLMNWDGYLAYTKEIIDEKMAADPNVQAAFDKNPQLYEMSINPPAWMMIMQVVIGTLVIALIALFVAFLLGKFRRKTEIFIPDNLIAEDGTLLVDNLVPPPVPVSEAPAEIKPEEK